MPCVFSHLAGQPAGKMDARKSEFDKVAGRYRQRHIEAISCYSLLTGSASLDQGDIQIIHAFCCSITENSPTSKFDFFGKCAEAHAKLQAISGGAIGVELDGILVANSYNQAIRTATALLVQVICIHGFESTNAARINKSLKVIAEIPTVLPTSINHAKVRNELLDGDDAAALRNSFATDWLIRAQAELLNVSFAKNAASPISASRPKGERPTSSNVSTKKIEPWHNWENDIWQFIDGKTPMKCWSDPKTQLALTTAGVKDLIEFRAIHRRTKKRLEQGS